MLGTVTTNIDPWAWGWTAVGALATTAAVLTALSVAMIQMRDLVRLRRRESADRRREQALRVSAWATSETEFPDTPSSNIVGNPWYAVVHVLNNSGASVSDVRVQIGHWSLSRQWSSLGETKDWPIVPPGGQVEAEFRQAHVKNFANPRNNVLSCTLSFRDSNNSCWHRDASNTLTESKTNSGTPTRKAVQVGTPGT
jgi:hypothetical protein